MLAQDGLARLTHRRVAQAAQVSLAATTYHYATKADMVDVASQRLLHGYIETLRRAADRQRTGERRYGGLDDFTVQVLASAADRDRQSSFAWCEIIFEAARTPKGHSLARSWFAALAEVWRDLAAAMGEPDDPCSILCAVDLAIGLLLMVLALGLSPAQVAAVLRDGANPVKTWLLRPAIPLAPLRAELRTPKAEQTHARILDGAIGLLIEQGAGAVTYRRVAEASGVTTTAPAYYFKSIADLLQTAESELFRVSKQRYREVQAATPLGPPSLDGLLDLTTAIFIREATEFGLSSVALYSIWLEAGRSPDVRPQVATAILDQADAWGRRLNGLGPTHPFDGMRMQASFIGKLIRTVSSGAPLEELAVARQEFGRAIRQGAP